jgi:CRISPR-associated protein Cst1
MNFRPEGQTFVPAAGPFVVALFFLPLASRRAEGRLLAVHADDPAMTLRFARTYLEDNRRLLALSLPEERALVHEGYDRELPMWDATKKRYKFADAKGPRSLVVSDLGRIAREAGPGYSPRRPVAIDAYLLSNSGQGPSFELFHIPSGATSFLVKAAGATTAPAWKAIAERFYPLKAASDDDAPAPPARARGKAAAPIAGRAGWTRNPAFEDLCAIFDAGFTDSGLAARWLRRYVLGRVEPPREEDEDEAPARHRVVRYEDARSPSWLLAELFLEEVMGMKKPRIEAIRKFADKLAVHIKQKHDRKLRHALFYGDLPRLRHTLRAAQRESLQDGTPPLFGLDEYAEVWLHEDGDERLVRDLLCIRVVERLHELGAPPEEIFDKGAEGADETEEANP